MLAQQLRQRGFRAVPAPSALAGQTWLRQQEAFFSAESDGKLPSSTPSASAAPGSATGSVDHSTPGAKNDQDVTGQPGAGTKAAPPQASRATSAGLAQLKAKLNNQVASSAQAGTPAAQSSKPTASTGKASQAQAAEASVQQRQAATFRGVSLQLGEAGNPLQSMAVLTHTDVRQLEEYDSNPLASDQSFLAKLQMMGDVPQERAATIMQMAAGTVPPPPVLVWAAAEVVAQLQRLLAEQLPPPGAGAEQAAALRAQPWYAGALQVARLALASRPLPPQQPQPQTELELLRAFAEGPAAAAPAPSPEQQDQQQQQQPQAAQPQPQQALPYAVSWESLLALPQLASVLDAASGGSPSLAASLELTRLRGAVTAATRTLAAAPAAPAAGKGGKKGAQKEQQQQQPKQQQPWLLPLLRSAAATARDKALEATGLAAAGADAPLNADAVLTALAMGTTAAQRSAAQRAAAAEWLAAAALLRHAEERLGCAGGSSGVRQEAVAVLHLLGLPLEPRELPYIDELKVSEEDVRGWVAQLAGQLAASGTTAAALTVPTPLESRLASARRHLAAAGRALVLASPQDAAAAGAAASAAVPTAPPGAPTPEATLAWLRAVGAPLASGLLSGGYGSVRKLQEMVSELREALVLRLLEAGRASSGTTALAAALYGDAEAAWRTARDDVAGVVAAAELLQREAVEAELDYVHERFVPPAPQLPPPPALPSDAELAAAIAALPPVTRQLYDSYYTLRPSGSTAADVVARRQVVEALAAAGEAAVRQAGGELGAWLADARKRLLVLPNPLLALLLRFLRVQVSVTPESAQLQRNKLTALAALVAAQQHRASSPSPSSSSDQAGAAALAAAARELGEWTRGEGSAGGLPGALAAVLGEAGAQDFGSWLQALALSSSGGGRGGSGGAQQSTHELLAELQVEQDVERYLTMTHDPRLHLSLGGLGSGRPAAAPPTTAAWDLPQLRRGEAEWLEQMRPQMDAYLQAMGHRSLGDAEWGVYRDTALSEWEAGRQAREERVAAAGQSGFFNPRADEVYLQQMLDQAIAPEDPLGPQSRRYLDTLLRNRTWTFAQRKQAVQRLIQLNAHFLRQPPAPEDGSPFAPLFAVGGPDPVPKLGPLRPTGQQQGGQEEVPGGLQRRWAALGHGSGAPVEKLKLPKGF